MPIDQDAFGNYVALNDAADLAVEFPPGGSFSGGIGLTLFGTGAPTSTPSNKNVEYIDKATGNTYYWNGSAWALTSGGGGGGIGTGGVFSGTGNPNGVITAPVGSIYNQISGGALVATWTKTSGAGNSGWQ